ncbi:MAG: hypothetical protein H7196_00745 [candidate division SR1 bacterium]|nr:hypothetical protein [candidate division SR1 bacterium]
MKNVISTLVLFNLGFGFFLPLSQAQALDTQDLKQKVSSVGSRFKPADQRYRSCKKSNTNIKVCISNYKKELVAVCENLSGVGLTTCLSAAEGKKRGAQLNNWLAK